jgi:hypothetical protein
MDVPLFDSHTGERIGQPQRVIPKPQRPLGERPPAFHPPSGHFAPQKIDGGIKIDRGILIETSSKNCLGWCCCAKQMVSVDDEHVTLEQTCCGRSEIAAGWLDSITGYQLYSSSSLCPSCDADFPIIRISGINGIDMGGITTAMVVKLDNAEQIRQVLVALSMNREIVMQAKKRTQGGT